MNNEKFNLPAGRYYIGDPCYLYKDSIWQDIYNRIADKLTNHRIAERVILGASIIIFKTRNGDGVYQAQDNTELIPYDKSHIQYPVDTGTLSICGITQSFLVNYHLNPHSFVDFYGDIRSKTTGSVLGNVITTDKSIDCYMDDWTIHIGDLIIRT